MADSPQTWRGRRVLITGGAGFIGSSICHALCRQGARLTVLDNLAEGGGGNPANLRGTDAELVHADLCTTELRAHCAGIDVVFNLAAQTGHMAAQADPAADLAVNAAAQLRLIEAVREVAPQAIVVHASTRQIYGRPSRLPVAEDHPTAPQDFNGVSKIAGEQYWMVEHRVHRRRVVSLRLTNCYGPRLRLRDGRQTFLGIWLRLVLQGLPFEVWDGRQIRDFLYIDDATDAFLAAATTPRCFGHTFNVGGPRPLPLLELAETLVQVAEHPAGFVLQDLPAERARIDIGSYHADDGAFRAVTGWRPRIGIAEGLRRSLEWYRSRLGAYA